MKNSKEKYLIILKCAILVVCIVLCTQTYFVFSKPWYEANGSLGYGLSAAEVISRTAIMLYGFNLALSFFKKD